MLSPYVLIGGPFEIYDTAHSGESHLFNCTLGAQFELEAEQANRSIADGAALLPKDLFDELGFSEDEIKKYPSANAQASAPAEFQAKLLAARKALHDYRAQLAPKTTKEA